MRALSLPMRAPLGTLSRHGAVAAPMTRVSCALRNKGAFLAGSGGVVGAQRLTQQPRTHPGTPPSPAQQRAPGLMSPGQGPAESLGCAIRAAGALHVMQPPRTLSAAPQSSAQLQASGLVSPGLGPSLSHPSARLQGSLPLTRALGPSRSHPSVRLHGSLPRAGALSRVRLPLPGSGARCVHATRVLSQRGWEQGHTGVIRQIERYTGREFEAEWVVYGIIIINCVVFLLWQNVRLQRFMMEHCTVSSRGVLRDGYLHTIFTHFWSHSSSGHLLGNMATLWFFGTELVGMLGISTFMKLYLGGGIISGVCQVAWPYIARNLPIPARYRDQTYFRGLGASGAINAVVAFSIMTFPARIILVWFILPVPSAALGMIFLGKDLVGMYQGNTSIANAAHVAGTGWGAAWWYVLRHRIGLRTW